tara:strand:+ start:1047 stop:2045 length:999 start_codon:yes stop_codon:yes gene_type:complete
MILKSYEIEKLNFDKKKFILLYGKNEGAKAELVDNLIKNSNIKKKIKFEEKEIIENNQNFFNEILDKSLFDEEKIIQINRASDKIFKVLENILDKIFDDTIVIINSDNLEKKSKLRNIFEKKDNLVCIPVYEDDFNTLSRLGITFIKKNNINISQSNINLLINKCSGDRAILKNELEKIRIFSLTKKNPTSNDLMRLTNLAENYGLQELIDSCLSKNIKKTMNILNENIYTNDDCILIVKTFINRSKRILKLCNEYEINNDLNLTITSAKPPIFWKEKEIIKKQISIWTVKQIKKLIYRLNDLELEIKKNFNNGINLIRDFMLYQSLPKTNN